MIKFNNPHLAKHLKGLLEISNHLEKFLSFLSTFRFSFVSPIWRFWSRYCMVASPILKPRPMTRTKIFYAIVCYENLQRSLSHFKNQPDWYMAPSDATAHSPTKKKWRLRKSITNEEQTLKNSIKWFTCLKYRRCASIVPLTASKKSNLFFASTVERAVTWIDASKFIKTFLLVYVSKSETGLSLDTHLYSEVQRIDPPG